MKTVNLNGGTMAKGKIGDTPVVSMVFTLDETDSTIVEIVTELKKLIKTIHKGKVVSIWQVFTNVKETHGLSFPLDGETVFISFIKRDKPTIYTGDTYIEVVFTIKATPTK